MLSASTAEPHGEPSGQALPVLHKEVGSEGGMQILPGVCGAWDPWCLLARFTHFKTNNLLDWSASFLSFFLFCFFFFPSAQSKSLDSRRTQGILLYRNPFFRQLCQECFHTLGWMGKKRA